MIVRQGATGYGCSSLVVNGVSFDSTYTVGTSTCISYPGGTVAVGSTTGYDIFNFVGVNTTGSAADITNYNFLSVKNGDFRLRIVINMGSLSSLTSLINQFGIAAVTGGGGGGSVVNWATGGIISDYEDSGTYYRAHIFNSTDTFEVTDSNLTEVEYLVVAGGGAGGSGYYGGGGGAGGLRTNLTGHPLTGSTPKYPVNPGPYSVQVGAGGVFSPVINVKGLNGTLSSFATITSNGGGGGGSRTSKPGSPGGSGGGGCSDPATGGSGNQPGNVTPPQGNPGGNCGSGQYGAGGGGAGEVVLISWLWFSWW